MKAFGLLPSNVEMIRINPLAQRLQPRIPFPHKHSFFQLVIITEGQGWHEIDFSRHPVRPGMIFMLKPGQVHAWELSASSEGYLVEFEFHALRSSPDGNDPLAQIHALPDAWERDQQQARVLRLCQDMLDEQREKNSGWENVLQLELLTLLFLLLRQAPKPATALEKDQTLPGFFDLISRYYQQQHSIEFYAKKLKLSPKALTMRVTRAFGVPPKKIIQDRCLLEAKRLLAYSNESSAAISKKIGFEDPNYFIRFFRSKTGMTPSDFRAQQQKGPLDKFHSS
jgi:AraC-like DNA-binding protein